MTDRSAQQPPSPGSPPLDPGTDAPSDVHRRPVGWLVAVFTLSILLAIAVTVIVMTVVLGDDGADSGDATSPEATTVAPTPTDTVPTTTTLERPTTTTTPSVRPFCEAWYRWESESATAGDVGPWVVDRWADLNAAAQEVGTAELRVDVTTVLQAYADLEAGGFALDAPSTVSDVEFLTAQDAVEDWARRNC